MSYSRAIVSERYRQGTVLTYSCNSGYYKIKDAYRRTCQSTGGWTGSHVVCKKGNENQATQRGVTHTQSVKPHDQPMILPMILSSI